MSYCAEYQAAGSAHRPGLIFYLHSFLLRISGQFSQLFTVNKLQSEPPISGRHVELRKRLPVWLRASETKKVQRLIHFGLRVGLVKRLIWAWQLARKRGGWTDGWKDSCGYSKRTEEQANARILQAARQSDHYIVKVEDKLWARLHIHSSGCLHQGNRAST